MSLDKAREVKSKKFCKAFIPGTQVALTGNPEKFFTVSEVSDGRMYIKIEGFTGIFLRTHIIKYHNKNRLQ